MNKETNKVTTPTGGSMIVHAILHSVYEWWFLQFTFDIEIAAISVFAVEIQNSALDTVLRLLMLLWSWFAFRGGVERLCCANYSVLPLPVVLCAVRQHVTQRPTTETVTAVHNKSQCRNMPVCCFDSTSPRISAIWYPGEDSLPATGIGTLSSCDTDRWNSKAGTDYIHWLFLHKRHTACDKWENCIYKHASGEISTVRLEIAGLGTRRTRLANSLPPDISGNTICTALSQYGEIQSIHDEKWSKNYR